MKCSRTRLSRGYPRNPLSGGLVFQPRKKRLPATIALAAMLAGQLHALPQAYADDRDGDRESHRRTATPIEHLIVVIPENRSYDHTFGTYVPRHGEFAS